MRVNRVLALFTIAAVVLLGLSAVGASAHTKRFPITGGTANYERTNTQDRFFGSIRSDADFCERGRRIRAVRTSNGNVEPSTLTDVDGRWAINLGRFLPQGSYHIQVVKKVLTPGNHRHTCQAAFAGPFQVGSNASAVARALR